MVIAAAATGRLDGSGQDDDLTAIAQKYKSDQIHIYALSGNDTIFLDFSNSQSTSTQNPIKVFSHGHHAFGDSPGSTNTGSDIFHFTNTNNVVSGGVVIGRLEDFDYSRDEIWIDGRQLDLFNLPLNIRIVECNGDHNDAACDPQQWLLIETAAGGHIFYCLEGARVDMDGNGHANNNTQERHFLEAAPNFANLKDVPFVDQVNVVPEGYKPQAGGRTINDEDTNASHVTAVISGSDYGDLIAAGLNDDTVHAGTGDDKVWGGSGHDSVNAGGGNDMVRGGTGNDDLQGATGADKLLGQNGDDTLRGGGGKDLLKGGPDADKLFGGTGNDTLDGGNGVDRLAGDAGHDTLIGGAGKDKLIGGAGNDTLISGSGPDVIVFGRGDDADVLTDFEDDMDTLKFKTDLLANGAPATVSEVMSHASLVTQGGTTSVLFDFGGGDTLLLEGFSDLSALWDDIVLI